MRLERIVILFFSKNGDSGAPWYIVDSGTPKRRERDSNPRYIFMHNGFQDRRLKQLGHLSKRQIVEK